MHVLLSLVFTNVDTTRGSNHVSSNVIASYVHSYLTGVCITVRVRNAAVISSLASAIGMGGVMGKLNPLVLASFHICSVSHVVLDSHSFGQWKFADLDAVHRSHKRDCVTCKSLLCTGVCHQVVSPNERVRGGVLCEYVRHVRLSGMRQTHRRRSYLLDGFSYTRVQFTCMSLGAVWVTPLPMTCNSQ